MDHETVILLLCFLAWQHENNISLFPTWQNFKPGLERMSVKSNQLMAGNVLKRIIVLLAKIMEN